MEIKKTGIRDWKLNDIKDGDIVVTQQGSRFVVDFSNELNQWTIIQSNEAGHPDLQGERFELEKYMQPNLEVVGSIYNNPELTSIEEKQPHEVSTVKCDLCGKEWIAVRPEGLTELECPNCENMVQFENV